jgi:hypothetical protein
VSRPSPAMAPWRMRTSACAAASAYVAPPAARISSAAAAALSDLANQGRQVCRRWGLIESSTHLPGADDGHRHCLRLCFIQSWVCTIPLRSWHTSTEHRWWHLTVTVQGPRCFLGRHRCGDTPVRGRCGPRALTAANLIEDVSGLSETGIDVSATDFRRAPGASLAFRTFSACR